MPSREVILSRLGQLRSPDSFPHDTYSQRLSSLVQANPLVNGEPTRALLIGTHSLQTSVVGQHVHWREGSQGNGFAVTRHLDVEAGGEVFALRTSDNPVGQAALRDFAAVLGEPQTRTPMLSDGYTGLHVWPVDRLEIATATNNR